jgi:tetratricopeptide (TPR) repeat protein
MRILIVGVSLSAFACGAIHSGLALAVAEETIPPGPSEKADTPRRLSDAEQARVTELTRSINRLRCEGKFTEAIESARQVADILERAVGPRDWRAADARREAETLQTIARLPADGRRAMAMAVSQAEETSSLQKNYRLREAETIGRRLDEGLRRWLGTEHPETATNCTRLALNLDLQGRHAEAKPLLQRALDMRVKVLGKGHPRTADSYDNLGVNLARQGRLADAQPLLRRALEIRCAALGEDHLDTATSYADSAWLLRELGRYADAQPLYQKALDIRRKALGETHPDTLTCTNDLAAILREQGRYADAEPLFRRAFESRRKALGDGHPDTADSDNDLAINLVKQSRFTEAEPLFRAALDVKRKVLGEGHPATGMILSNLGTCLGMQGKLAEAESLLRRGLEVRRKALGEVHPETAKAYHSLAAILGTQGQYAAADPLLRTALEINRKVLGEGHPNTGAVCGNLAININNLGRHADAEPLFRKALEVKRKALGDSHSEVAEAYLGLGVCLLDLDRYDDALALLRKSLDVNRKALGDEHPGTAKSYQWLADVLLRLGRYTEAETLLRQTLRVRREMLGAGHRLTAETYAALAKSLRNQGRYAEAQPFVQRALDIRRQALGEGHRLTGNSYGQLAWALQDQGRYADAEPLFRRALDICSNALGEGHPDTAASNNDLAANLGAQGRHAEAEPLLRRALEIYCAALGEDRLDTAASYENLAVNLSNRGMHSDAEPLLRKALNLTRNVLGEGYPRTAHCYINLGADLLAQGRYAEAEPLFRKALEIYRPALGEGHPVTAAIHHNLGISLDFQGRLDEAIAAYEAAAASIERSRSALAITGVARSQVKTALPLPALAVALARRGRPREAWRRWEASLARGLLDDLTVRLLRPLTALERERETELLVRLSVLDEQIGKLANRPRRTPDDNSRLEQLYRDRDTQDGNYMEFERSLEAAYGAFAGRPAGLEQVQAALSGDTALVGWVDLSDAASPTACHWACVVRREGEPVWVKIPGTGPNGAWISADGRRTGALRAALATRDASWRQLATAVAAQRLGPLRADLHGVRSLVVLASPGLAGVPVEVLVEAWPEAPKNLTVSYAPSATLFKQLARARSDATAPPKLLALGDPAYPIDTPAPVPPPPRFGLAVRSVAPKGNAGLAGVRAGDVLLSYNGRNLNSRADLTTPEPDTPDKRVKISLWRDGDVRTLELAAGPLGMQVDDARPAALAVLARRSADSLLMRLTRGEVRQRLPGTRREVEAIAALLPNGQTTVLLGEAASDQALQGLARSGALKRYRYLHFAAHCETNPAVALSSALILAPDSDRPSNPRCAGTDGRVTAQQIAYTWELDANLVVLSACGSGLGRYAKEEGYLGFAQALFAKGARSLVVSQWRVDDRSTALLMVRFYQNLLGRRTGLRQPMPKPEALAEAKRWLRELTAEEAGATQSTLDRGEIRPLATAGQPRPDGNKPAGPRADSRRPYAHPYYWAPFIMVGDPN